jgi:hypothetical protein
VDYRVFLHDRESHILNVEVLEAESDEHAIEQAAKIEHPHAKELWQRSRLVHRFEPGF